MTIIDENNINSNNVFLILIVEYLLKGILVSQNKSHLSRILIALI